MRSRVTLTILLVMVLVTLGSAASAGGGGTCEQALTTGSGTEVAITQSCFEPAIVHTVPGDTVTFTNADPYPHNLVGHGLEWGTVDVIPTGGSMSATFDVAGIHPFTCTLHPGMVGAVVVGDSVPSAAAVTPAPLAAEEAVPSADSTPSAIPWPGIGLVAGGAAIGAAAWRLSRPKEQLTA